jgi:tRNA A-37 threonylcarbamoyl transferase component Bud32
MSVSWFVASNLPDEVKEAFSDLDAVFSLQGNIVSADSMGNVARVNIAGKYYFIKRAFCGGRHLRKYFGRSRLRAEKENIEYFTKLGFLTPKVIAFGEEKLFGPFATGRSVLITEQVANAKDLEAISKENPELFNSSTWRKKVLQGIADFLNRIHSQRFIHNDLNWRNILVTLEEEPKCYFFDAPMGRKYQLLFRRFAAKDLAYLDKLGHLLLSRTWRLRFYLFYAKTRKLSAKNKKQILRSFEFFKERREKE